MSIKTEGFHVVARPTLQYINPGRFEWRILGLILRPAQTISQVNGRELGFRDEDRSRFPIACVSHDSEVAESGQRSKFKFQCDAI